MERPLAAGLSPTRPFAAHFHAPEGMVLLREPPDLIGFFAGSLGSLFMEDVFAYILSGIRSGHLIVQHQTLRRAVTFRDGQVIFATSSERYERLGAVLVKLGIITSDQLTRAVSLVTPTRRIGQVLTTEGMVSEANLYNAMTYLVREVVLNLFDMVEGSFLFQEAQPPLGDVVKLPERTRDLVIQGIKRGEATTRLRRQFPDDVRVGPGPDGLPPGEEALLARLRQGVTVKELRTSYEGSMHAYLTWAEERVRDGSLVLEPAVPAAPPPRSMGEVLGSEMLSPEERYNLLLSLVYRAVEEEGRDVGMLRGFLKAPPPGLEEAYAGVELDVDGRVDVSRIRHNVSGGDEALARALTMEALDAFVSYALFSAQNVLPKHIADQLSITYRALQEGLT
ncbi:DUF4388 domain-containing protein [Hyalangium sp. s54d21]|uniref:DUF4388 domain-containing protein n=1 Tax=Hyalangium rubrum TaxID=3103134 RepID=A0ABU5H8D0_9BACT|nr:DUF4388 domain-containing protein [Hyalangium sp. s54d21]